MASGTPSLTDSPPEPEGLLLILPPAPGPHAVSPGAPVAGLALLRRIALAADRAGFDVVLASGVPSAHRALLAGTSARRLDDGPLPSDLPRRIVLLAGNVVPQAGWLGRLRTMPMDPDRLHVDAGAGAVIEVKDPDRVVAVAAQAGSAAAAVSALGAMFETAPAPPDAGGRFPLAGPADIAAAESWLLRGLIKPSEGFMSRHVERRLSLTLTRQLVRTRVTPNAMTLVSVGIGLASSPFFLSPAPAWQVAGALLFLAHSILDGCDGELARLKFLESPRGAILDFWGDNLVHAAVFSAMAAGWSLAAGSGWPLLLGGVAVASTAGAAMVVYERGVLARPPADDGRRSSRLVEALAHRDFIYVIVALAVAGRAAWFLVLAAIGTPIFLALLLWSTPRRFPTRDPVKTA